MTEKQERWTERESGAEADLGDLLLDMWSARLLVVAVVLFCTVLATGYALVARPIYTAKVSILPGGSEGTPGALAQLASIAGAIPRQDSGYEQLYPEIVRSDRVLDRIIDRRWSHASFPAPVTLHEILGFEPSDSTAAARREADYELKRAIRERFVRLNRNELTGFMVLQVSIPEDPRPAAAVANALASELESIVVELKQTQAGEHRRFVENRLSTVGRELERAESDLTEFLIENRAYRESPHLTQEHASLEREVAAQTSVWIELRKQLELAKIEEDKEGGSVVVLDDAKPTMRRSHPRSVVIVVVGFVLGCVLAVAILVGRVMFSMLRSRWSSRAVH